MRDYLEHHHGPKHFQDLLRKARELGEERRLEDDANRKKQENVVAQPEQQLKG